MSPPKKNPKPEKPPNQRIYPKVTLYREGKNPNTKPGEEAALQNTVEKLPRHTPFGEQHPHPAADKCCAHPTAAGEHLPLGRRAAPKGQRWDLGSNEP